MALVLVLEQWGLHYGQGLKWAKKNTFLDAIGNVNQSIDRFRPSRSSPRGAFIFLPGRRGVGGIFPLFFIFISKDGIQMQTGGREGYTKLRTTTERENNDEER